MRQSYVGEATAVHRRLGTEEPSVVPYISVGKFQMVPTLEQQTMTAYRDRKVILYSL